MYKDVIMRTEVDPKTGRSENVGVVKKIIYCNNCRYAKKNKGTVKCTLFSPPRKKDPMGYCDEGASNVISMQEACLK